MDISPPLTEEVLEKLKAGDQITITGVIYTARDAAHKRLFEALEKGEKLPIDIRGQILYYVGPTPPKPGQAIGSAGPTTSVRMDVYTPRLLAAGLKGTIGKGARRPPVREAMVKYKAVYLGAIGGAGALLSKHVKRAEVVAYEELGTEAIRRLEVEKFPVIVVNDIYGKDVYEEGKKKYRQETPLKA
ncbi:MAG: Fe-S-containing hydro-lyase [Chloroflexi bacterium]|nr:Fe-S-containing hydro-lyase [Chloroflexota bacterium]